MHAVVLRRPGELTLALMFHQQGLGESIGRGEFSEDSQIRKALNDWKLNPITQFYTYVCLPLVLQVKATVAVDD